VFERDGIVRRTVYPTVPVTVEYCLTPLGTTLIQSVNALVRWTVEHEHEIAAARSTYDARLREPVMLQPLDRAGRMSSWLSSGPARESPCPCGLGDRGQLRRDVGPLTS
jgi:HxlR-like helix-turn-helix